MVHQKHFPLHKPQLDIERKKSSWPGQLSLAKKHPLLYAFVALPLLLPPPPPPPHAGGYLPSLFSPPFSSSHLSGAESDSCVSNRLSKLIDNFTFLRGG